MKIAHVFKDYYPPLAAGITRYIRDIAEGAAAHGHDVEVHVAGVRHSRRDKVGDRLVVHRHREFGRLLSSPLAPGLVTDVSRLDTDVLHLHMPNPLGELGALRHPPGPRIVVTYHAQLGRQRLLEPLYGPLRNGVLRRASAILVSSSAMAACEELRPYSRTLRVLPFGASPALVSGLPVQTRPRSEGLRLLFVGRLVYYKGLDIMLRAMKMLPGVELSIVGEGPLQAELVRSSRELGLSSRVHFLGNVPDETLRALYAQHDLFVLPSVSRAEAFGLAMLEAMASGLPVVSTQLGTGTDWVNEDGVTGIVVAAGDEKPLARAVRLMEDDNRRHGMGLAARQRVRDHFSFEHHLSELLTIYTFPDSQ